VPLLVIGWLAVVIAGSALAAAAHSMKLLPGDLAVTRELQETRSVDAVFGPLMHAVSVLGNHPWDVLLYVPALAVPALLRRWGAALLLAFTATGDAMSAAVKLLVARERPPADLVTIAWDATGYSFPSGHTVHYVVFFGALAYLCYRALRHDGVLSGLVRLPLRLLLVTSVILVALVGMSRVYLGAHWPSDVVGGYLLGGAWLSLLLAAHRRWVHH
jgi:undecaprenyl-diphosphatase